MLKVGDYVHFTCRCTKECRRYADQKDVLLVAALEGNGVRLTYLNGEEFYNGYYFLHDNVVPTPFLGAAAEAIRSARETG